MLGQRLRRCPSIGATSDPRLVLLRCHHRLRDRHLRQWLDNHTGLLPDFDPAICKTAEGIRRFQTITDRMYSIEIVFDFPVENMQTKNGTLSLLLIEEHVNFVWREQVETTSTRLVNHILQN